MSETKKEIYSALSQLIQVAKSDGNLHDEEVKFIHVIGIQMGLNDKEMLGLIKDPAPYKPFESELDRIVQFQRICLLMHVDGGSSATEIKTIKNIGLRLGLNPRATGEVIKAMDSSENKLIPPEELLKIYLKYNN